MAPFIVGYPDTATLRFRISDARSLPASNQKKNTDGSQLVMMRFLNACWEELGASTLALDLRSESAPVNLGSPRSAPRNV